MYRNMNYVRNGQIDMRAFISFLYSWTQFIGILGLLVLRLRDDAHIGGTQHSYFGHQRFRLPPPLEINVVQAAAHNTRIPATKDLAFPLPLNSMLFKAANPSQYLTVDGSFESFPLPPESSVVSRGNWKRRKKKLESLSSNIDFGGRGGGS